MATNVPRNRHGNVVYRNNRGHGNGNAGHGNGNNGGHGNGNGNGYGNGNQGGYGYGIEPRPATAKEQLHEVLHVIFKRRKHLAAIFLAVFLVILLPSLLLRRTTYLATAKVNISTDRANLTVQPTEQDTLNLVKLNEAIVNSEVHLIRSRDMLVRVAKKLDVQEAGGVAGLANAQGDEDEKIGGKAMQLESRLKVTPIRASNVIQIDYADTDPKQAARVVKEVLEEYLAYHAEVHGPRNLSSFFKQQGKLIKQSLEAAEQDLRDTALRAGVVAPAAEIQNMVQAIGEMENQLRMINGQIIGSEEKLRIVREQLAEQPALVKRAQFLEVNPVVKQLTGHLIDRRVDRVALLRKYTDEDRRLRDNAEEITEIQTQLDETVRDNPTVVSQQIFRSNPVYDSRLTQLLDLEASLKELRARKADLEDSLARTRKDVIQLKQAALDYDARESEVQSKRASLELYEKRETEARLSELMDEEKLVNVEVVQRPQLPLRKTAERTNSWMIALISGLAVSLGFCFGAEYLNRTLRFDRDVEQYLGLPVLGGIRETGHL